MSAVLI